MAGSVYAPKECEYCGASFTPTTGSAKYCPEHSKGSWERNNPEAAAASQRRGRIRHGHKLEFGSADTYVFCVEMYGEVCGICGIAPDESFHLAVDRDHETDEIRGLVCPRHNTGLGFFQDIPALLRAAADYLETSPRFPLDAIPTDGAKHERVGRGTTLVDGKRIPTTDVDPLILAELEASKKARRRQAKAEYKSRQKELVASGLRWARDYTACQDCGTTERAHVDGGLCGWCLRAKRDRAKILDGWKPPSP